MIWKLALPDAVFMKLENSSASYCIHNLCLTINISFLLYDVAWVKIHDDVLFVKIACRCFWYLVTGIFVDVLKSSNGCPTCGTSCCTTQLFRGHYLRYAFLLLGLICFTSNEYLIISVFSLITGRSPNTKRLNLEAVGVELDRAGAVKVSSYLSNIL